MDAQGAMVRWVDHSGMYADAMTKKNGNVPLLQMLLRTGRICITEESITLEKHKSNPSSRNSSSKTHIDPVDASCDGCSVLIVIPGGVSCKIDQYLLLWCPCFGMRRLLQNKVVCKRPPCQQISKPEEVPGSCQQLCAHIGSVGFVYLQHLSCVPSCLRFFSHGVLFVKFLCAPVFVCLKGPGAYVRAVSFFDFDVTRCTPLSETVLRPSS